MRINYSGISIQIARDAMKANQLDAIIESGLMVPRTMAVLNVLCVANEDFARNLGKRTDDRDVESYIHKEMRNEQTDTLTFLNLENIQKGFAPY